MDALSAAAKPRPFDRDKFALGDAGRDEGEPSEPKANERLDGPEAIALHKRVMSWLQYERDAQAEERVEMARDDDFRSGIQWSDDEIAELRERGQGAMTYNQIAVAINWLIGSEKRNRVDWRVLPREASDHEMAAIKTKVLKYISDVNRAPYARSAAFAEAATSGLSWLEDNLNSDATGDILYSGHESWRCVLRDSHARRLDYKDGRYLFRWRVLDTDVAKAMFPGREAQIEMASKEADQLLAELETELWYLGESISNSTSRRLGGMGSVGQAIAQRSRVRVYECWYKVPERVDVVRGGPFNGEPYDPEHAGIQGSIDKGEADYFPAMVMKMHCVFFTERDLLEMGPTPFRHNDFPLTPVWCFRRGRDGAPYGYVRDMRDPQSDLNRRMAKSLFLLSVNQLITEQGAFDTEGAYTLQDAIDNAGNPQGVFILKDGAKRFEIRRDYAEIQGQAQQIEFNLRFMQTGSGITDELLGRRTNAVSGEAIKARQDQGSSSTAGIFDNYRLALSISGQKSLSNAEKFYSTPKVIRLTEWAPSAEATPDGQPAGLEWVRINQPELQSDGSIRFLNDMTASMADYVVDEQDFRASMRQGMFESMTGMLDVIAKVAPRMAVSMLDMVVDLNDFPGKEAMVDRLKKLIAEERGETPQAAQASGKRAALEERAAAAKIAKDEAAADKADAEADQIRSGLAADAVAIDLQRKAVGLDAREAQLGQQQFQQDQAAMAANQQPQGGAT